MEFRFVSDCAINLPLAVELLLYFRETHVEVFFFNRRHIRDEICLLSHVSYC
jgi:hypothetical protein